MLIMAYKVLREGCTEVEANAMVTCGSKALKWNFTDLQIFPEL